MKDIETIITAHLNSICEMIDKAHKSGLPTSTGRVYLDGACDLANVLGFTTDYNPIDNTFTVTVVKED